MAHSCARHQFISGTTALWFKQTLWEKSGRSICLAGAKTHVVDYSPAMGRLILFLTNYQLPAAR